MSNTRVQLTHPLPAPVVHAGFSIPQSKSHVLAGVQDAYWSDDEAESAECPLCMEEMDIDDLNFKPCICGYQICRFCWHHIKENLNKLCPACRREYSDDPIEFKAIAKEDHKRLQQQKKQRERERKDLDALGRRHLANVRVVQRNVVYVVGIGPKFAKEELISTLRSHEFFGQYGKISKIVIVKRNPPGGGAPVVGLYITYHRREDAARCIAAVDGTASPGGGSRDIMRASYGTTKYCMSFLRGASCNDHSCMNLHEWGEEKDCFTKEDLTTLKHTMKATESRMRTTGAGRRGEESEALPKAASWGHKGSATSSNSTIPASHTTPTTSTSRTNRRVPGVRHGRATVGPLASQNSNGSESRTSTRGNHDRKQASVAQPVSQSSSPPPGTPAPPGLPQRPVALPDVKVLQQSEVPPPSSSPAPSTAAESDVASSMQELPASPAVQQAATITAPSAPPGLPSVPPGLSAPPGIPSPSRPPRGEAAHAGNFQSSYQMSTAAQALLADMQARREAAPSQSQISPFPDFDRMLQNLSDGDKSGFSFTLDPSLAIDAAEEPLPDFEAEANTPFHGTYMDAFPALRSPGQPPGLSPSSGQNSYTPPPGLSYPHNPTRSIYDPLAIRASSISTVEQQSTGGSYTGTFNPFADTNEDTQGSPSRRPQLSPLDDDGRKVSRFGFARGRQGSTAASSPLHTASPLSNTDSHSQAFYSSADYSQSPLWSGQSLPFTRSGSAAPSPLALHAQPAAPPNRYQSFESGVSEAQLRDFIQSSRERAGMGSNNELGADMASNQHHPFQDPAIMSAKFASEGRYMPSISDGHLPPHLTYGPPPGLSIIPNLLPPNHSIGNVMENTVPVHASSTSPILSSTDFPALNATGPDDPSSLPETPLAPAPASDGCPAPTPTGDKADKKAAKKAERAAERQRVAQEKAATKAAEKARLATEKAAEKEKAAALKAQQDKEQVEKERQRAAKLEREKLAQAEREKVEREKAGKEKAALAEKERLKTIQAAKDKAAQMERNKKTANQLTPSKPVEHTRAGTNANSNSTPGSQPSPTKQSASPPMQVPLLSKKPKKNKPIPKPVTNKFAKDDELGQDYSASPTSANAPETTYVSLPKISALDTSSVNSRAQSVDRQPRRRMALAALMDKLNVLNPTMDLPNHPFFDTTKINPAAKMPLEYGPLVHALSALSVGGGSFANNLPSRSIDNAVSSFQQLLETLTQTISDLLRLLPRTTWDDSSSFDGVLRDMLKGDDFLDDGGEEAPAKEDEVAALTLALERRARWMEVQLSKLEELHRDINNAAVRAVLSFNDSGWDRHGSLPRAGNTLRRFDNIGMIDEGGTLREMTTDELEKKLVVAKEAAVFAEAEFREVMEKMQAIRPEDSDY